MKLNDDAVPSPWFDLTGKTMKLTYDGNGALGDLTPPPGMDPAIAAFVKGMIGTLFGSRSVGATLRVGETAVLPFAAGMPMAGTAALPMNLTGETRMTLTG